MGNILMSATFIPNYTLRKTSHRDIIFGRDHVENHRLPINAAIMKVAFLHFTLKMFFFV